VDYLLICHISGLSIRGVDQPSAVSVANAERLMHISAPPPRMTTTCRIDVRLIDPTTGAAAATVDDSFNRVCSPQAMGLNIPAPMPTVLHLSDEQLDAVLRVVLDDAMRKLLPEADVVLTLPGSTAPVSSEAAAAAPTTAELIHGAETTQPAVAKLHCPECGAEVSPDDEFCPNCGARLLLNGVRVKPAAK
jgi:DNA-directed RNA polymerase subunit RPC12/RpoP